MHAVWIVVRPTATADFIVLVAPTVLLRFFLWIFAQFSFARKNCISYSQTSATVNISWENLRVEIVPNHGLQSNKNGINISLLKDFCHLFELQIFTFFNFKFGRHCFQPFFTSSNSSCINFGCSKDHHKKHALFPSFTVCQVAKSRFWNSFWVAWMALFNCARWCFNNTFIIIYI